MSNVQAVYLEDASSGRWHQAMRVDGGEPLVPDACNISGDRTYHAELPDGLTDALLCDRCFRAARTATATAGGPVYTERPTLDTRGPDDR